MHIVHVVYCFDTGGLENGLVNLINNMDDEKYTHSIVTMVGHNETFAKRLIKPIQIYSLNKQPGKDLGVFVRAYKLFKKIAPDIVHTRNFATLEMQLPAFFAGITKSIHGEHGWDIFDPKGTVKKYQWVRRVLSPLVSKFVPLSSELESYLVDSVGIKTKKIVRICNGVDLKRFDAEEGLIDPFPFNEPTQRVFGSVGRLEEIKDHFNLICAFNFLISNNAKYRENSRLVLVGDGSQRAKIEQYILDNNLQDLVWMAGNRREIPALMKCFDVFILPSKAEGISNTILEAMASELPVIATKVGGNGDLVNNGITGTLVDPHDSKLLAIAMAEYIENPDQIKLQGEQGLARVRHEFSLDTMVKNYSTLYDNLFSQKINGRNL